MERVKQSYIREIITSVLGILILIVLIPIKSELEVITVSERVIESEVNDKNKSLGIIEI